MKRLNTNSLRSLLLSLLPLVLSLGAAAQSQTGFNWYFGNSPQGVKFSRSDKSASLVNNLVPLGTGGSAVASSPVNGDVFFYSDGINIYDVSNQPMPNGTGLGGNPAGNQGVAVAQVPGQANQYYVFVNSASEATGGSVSYRTVDMSLPGNSVFPNPIPLGAVTAATNTSLPGLSNTAESMLVVQQANSENFYLITHDNGTNTYTVTLFTSAGPQPPVTYNVGVITQPGNLAFHAGTNKIAVSPQEGNRNVEILNFDPATGALTFDQDVPNSAVTSATGPAIYDTEWSFSGTYLYISSEGQPGVPGNVMQYDLANPTVTMPSILPQPNTIYQSYGLQMGPDSTIYHLYQATLNGPFLMGSISDTDSVAAKVIYTPQAFPGNVNFGGKQFPSFAPSDSADLSVTFTSNGTCANAPTAFFPTVIPGADSLRWDFGDGSGASDWSPVYTYTAGGTYNVAVTAYLNGQTASFTQPVTITDFDTQISLVQDTTACSCELPFPKNPHPTPSGSCTPFSVKATTQGSGTPTLQWFGPGGLIPGATTATLAPDSAGYYYLVATVGGCATYAGVNIKEYDVEDQRANVWYFGDKAGIDFNPNIPNAPVAISNTVMDAPAGTSTISDRNGQVIFFTDGVSVWDRNFTLVSAPPPPGIGGSATSTQAALIIPVPGDETLFYIFTTKDVYGDGTFELRYSLFDLKMNGGTGGMLEENQLLFARSTERITGNDGWLIAHEYGNNSFRAYPISNLGIGSPVISAIGSDHSITAASTAQGYMKLGPQDRLAVALSDAGKSNVVELFNFNNTTGKITNFKTADLNTPAGQVYGVEFSPGGNKLYATLRDGANSKLVEFALDSLTGAPTLMTPPLATSGDLGAIQIGPDGQVYVAENGQGTLGRIQPNEDKDIASTYRPGDFPLAGGTSSNLGLPNFIQSLADPIQGPFLSIAGQCVLDSVTFTGTPTDPIDKFFWQVRLGASVVTTSTAQEFKHFFTTPGLYDVSLRLTNRCGLDTTLVQQLRINDLPPDPTTSAVLCTGAAVLDGNPTNLPGLSYVWSTGDTTETITVNQRGYYDITVTNAAGCSVDGRILAADNRPQVDLGSNVTICQGTAVAPLDALNPGATYVWTRNGVAIPGGTRRTQAVSTSTAGPPTFEYEVTVTDPITTCFIKDSVIYTINALPVITTPVANSIACGATTGTIDLSITSPATALFTYSITGPSTTISDTDLNVGPIPQATGLAAGTYSITVADQVTLCAVTTAATINNNNFTVAGLQDVTCDPININATITPTGPPSASYTWRVIDTSLPLPPVGQGVQTGSTSVVAFSTSSASTGPIGLPSNNEQYIVEVKDVNNCISSSPPITVNHDPKVPAVFDIACDPVAPVSITASQGDFFTWSGPNIIGGSSTQNKMLANPPAGTQQYQVVITQATFCELDTTLSVVVQPPILAAIDQSSACSDLVTVTATPNGNFLYRWFINNVYQPTLGGPDVFANLGNDGQQFSVSIQSPVTGCESTSNALIVQVDNQLTVALTSTTPCEGSPFTLTATPSRTATFVWAVDGSPIAGQTAGTLQEQRGGLYKVTASAAACEATDEIDITLAPVTAGLLNEEAFICPDQANPDPNTRSVVLRPGDFAAYDWYKDGTSLGINTPTLTADEPGLYNVLLQNAFGCESSDKTNVLVECDPVIVGPNAFRPTSSVIGLEGDMVNQSFHLYTFFIDDEDFEVFIFNRWGEMIFQSGQRDFRWNGGYKNNIAQLSPPGTYSYLVRYKSAYRPEKGIMEKRGGVVLMR